MIGKKLGQYKLLVEIGKGGMGVVYKAFQTSLNREVALKILPQTLSSDENLIKRFHREAEAAARLSHPNIIQIFDISEIDGIHFFAMEYIKGEALTQRIESEGTLSIKEATRIAISVADALSYSHIEGIIHRDIKPGNIMIDSHGRIKVTDFGLARAMESSRLTITGVILGTPEYMSPEQARGELLDGRSDIYSLGVVLYEALTGKVPFEATTPFAVAQKQIYNPLPSPRSMRPEISDALEKIILKATEKDPQKRYQSAESIKRDLEASRGDSLERITPTVSISVTRRGALKKIVVAVAPLVIASVFFSLLKHRSNAPEEVIEIPPEGIEVVSQGVGSASEDDAQEEIQNKEIELRFNYARSLADRGETVQATLEFGQIARDYPGSGWEKRCKGEVVKLEEGLKETEAEKKFLEADGLKRENKFIEAAQLYQNIITRFPQSSWAKKAEQEIARLKEEAAHFRKKIEMKEESPQPQEVSPEEKFEIEKKNFEDFKNKVKSNNIIGEYIERRDVEGLSSYIMSRYYRDLKEMSQELNRTSREIAWEIAEKLVHEP